TLSHSVTLCVYIVHARRTCRSGVRITQGALEFSVPEQISIMRRGSFLGNRLGRGRREKTTRRPGVSSRVGMKRKTMVLQDTAYRQEAHAPWRGAVVSERAGRWRGERRGR